MQDARVTEDTWQSALDDLDRSLADLRRFWQHQGLSARFFAQFDMPVEFGTLRVLKAISDLEDPSVGAVARALRVDASAGSRVIDQAVNAGYVKREPWANDRRRVVLTLTQSGEAVLQRTVEVRRNLLTEITADWTEQEVILLTRLLERLSRDVDDYTA